MCGRINMQSKLSNRQAYVEICNMSSEEFGVINLDILMKV